MNDTRLRVLDTNTLSMIQRNDKSVAKRLSLYPPAQIAITIVTVEEQMRGWVAQIKREKKLEKLVLTYARFQAAVIAFSKVKILPFTQKSANQYQILQQKKIRIGTPDLRIAAIALAFNGVVVTSNVRHFNKVPDLRIEDWTRI